MIPPRWRARSSVRSQTGTGFARRVSSTFASSPGARSARSSCARTRGGGETRRARWSSSTGPGPSSWCCSARPRITATGTSSRAASKTGESPAAAARRELAEETELADPLRFDQIPLELGYRHTRGGLRVRGHPFAAEAPAGWEPTLNEEHVDHRWLSEEDANALLEFPEPRQAVSAVARGLEEGR